MQHTTLDTVPDFASYGMWVRGTRHLGTALGDCVYYRDERPDPPPRAAIAPGCTTSELKWNVQQGDTQDDEVLFALSTFGPVFGIGG